METRETKKGRKPFKDYCAEVFDPDKVWEKPEALEGIRVIDMTQYILGPLTSALLAEMGAEVIKIEHPMGDPFRRITPFHPETKEPVLLKGEGLGYLENARNKYHITLDFHKEKAREIYKKLVTKSDVVVENFRPGTFDRWGIGYRDLAKINPRLIYLWEGGFGQWGPWSERPSFDPVGQAMSGYMWITGFPEEEGGMPTKSGIYLCDVMGGAFGAFAVMVALFYRERTGKGQFIENSQHDCIMRVMGSVWLEKGITGKGRSRFGNWDVTSCVYGFVKCKDGLFEVTAPTDRLWEMFCRCIGREDLLEDPRLKTVLDRLKPENQKYIYGVIEDWAKDKTRDEIEEIFTSFKPAIPGGPVLSIDEVVEVEHYKLRKSIREVDDPYYGKLLVAGIPTLYSETPGRIKWQAKPIGADNEYIFRKYLGYTKEDLAKLKEEGVI